MQIRGVRVRGLHTLRDSGGAVLQDRAVMQLQRQCEYLAGGSDWTSTSHSEPGAGRRGRGTRAHAPLPPAAVRGQWSWFSPLPRGHPQEGRQGRAASPLGLRSSSPSRGGKKTRSLGDGGEQARLVCDHRLTGSCDSRDDSKPDSAADAGGSRGGPSSRWRWGAAASCFPRPGQRVGSNCCYRRMGAGGEVSIPVLPRQAAPETASPVQVDTLAPSCATSSPWTPSPPPGRAGSLPLWSPGQLTPWGPPSGDLQSGLGGWWTFPSHLLR